MSGATPRTGRDARRPRVPAETKATKGASAEHVVSSPRARREAQTADALARGLEALMSLGPEGRYEGEMRWCAMLSAQYVLAHELTGRTLPDERRAQLLRYCEHTRGTHGVYGLHDHAGPSLFVTTLVYAAARALGADADAPWLAPARQLFETEDVLGIPTWGRVWLALLGAYEWDGIHPMPAWIWGSALAPGFWAAKPSTCRK